MGGACWLLSEDGKTRTRGPPATDNFQVKPFIYPPPPDARSLLPPFPPAALEEVLRHAGEPREWWSVEQCLQAQKFSSHDAQEYIRSVGNRRCNFHGTVESDDAHGNRMWSEGQRASGNAYRGDVWDACKIDTMVVMCLCKVGQNADLKAQLLATGNKAIQGCHSTEWNHPTLGGTNWMLWNGVVNEYVRELLREPADRNAAKMKELETLFAKYRDGYKK